MANKPKSKIHENAQDVIEDRPYCKGRIVKGKNAGKRCKLQSTLLGDEFGEPACQWHGGRSDGESQRKPRSSTVSSLSSKKVEQGGVSVMGTTTNATHSSRWTQLCEGIISVQDLDDEELAKGKVRDADGVIRGRATTMVPRSLAQAMRAELFDRVQQVFETDIIGAAQILGEIARDPDVEPQHRIKAAGMIIERVMGKNPETLRITAEKPYEQLMTKIMRVEPAALDPMIVEHREATGDDRY